jgi:hypothetical protein
MSKEGLEVFCPNAGTNRASDPRHRPQPSSSWSGPNQSESFAPIHRLRCSVTANASSGVITNDEKLASW